MKKNDISNSKSPAMHGKTLKVAKKLCSLDSGDDRQIAGLSPLLTESEAAQLLNVTYRHLVNLRNRGVVPYYRIGRSIRYSPEKLLSSVEVQIDAY